MKTPSQIVYELAGGPGVDGAVEHDPEPCWLCAGDSTRGVPVRKWTGSNFTDYDRVRCPNSAHACVACVHVCSWTDPPGRRSSNPDSKRGTMFRMYSHLWEDGGHGIHAPGYVNCTKADKPWIRAFIEHDHTGAWFCAVADSGKKHTLPFVRLNAPGRGGVVIFDSMIVRVPADTSLVHDMCDLLTAGPSKAEIESGDYSPPNWQRCMPAICDFEERHESERGGAWFTFAIWIAQRDESATAARVAAEKEAKSAKQTRKGAAENTARRGRAAGAAAIPVGSEPEHSEALGSTARSDEASGPNDRNRGGMGVEVRSRDGSPSADQPRLPGID